MIWTVADVDNVKSNAPNVDCNKTYFGDNKYAFFTLRPYVNFSIQGGL